MAEFKAAFASAGLVGAVRRLLGDGLFSRDRHAGPPLAPENEIDPRELQQQLDRALVRLQEIERQSAETRDQATKSLAEAREQETKSLKELSDRIGTVDGLVRA